MNEHVDIAIIGSGFAGIGAAVRLQQAGFEDYVVLERANDVGGTWRDNSYPGCACDVPSHLYSFSFAPNPAWTRSFSPQPEIWAYLRGVADEHGVTARTRFGAEVLDAAWNADSGPEAVITTSAVSSPRLVRSRQRAGPASQSARSTSVPKTRCSRSPYWSVTSATYCQISGWREKLCDHPGFGANENEYRCEGTSQAHPG